MIYNECLIGLGYLSVLPPDHEWLTIVLNNIYFSILLQLSIVNHKCIHKKLFIYLFYSRIHSNELTCKFLYFCILIIKDKGKSII